MKETPNSLARKIAATEGKVRYWTGIPCKKGHVADMITVSGTCSECRNINMRAFRKRRGNKRYAEKKVKKRPSTYDMNADTNTVLPELMDRVIPGARVYLCGKRVI